MIAIQTDDGISFEISKDGALITASREELHCLLDEANVLLYVTQERELDHTHGDDYQS